MRLEVLLLLVAPLCVVGSLPERILQSPQVELWKKWKSLYHKQYDSEVEELTRFDIWMTHLTEVMDHNARYDLELETFKRGMVATTDLTFQEFQATYLGAVKSNTEVTNVQELPDVTLPTTVDWRTKGYVTAVKNQGQCGSCWTFSTTGCIEGQHFNSSGNLVSLSEQQLVDCDSGNYGCNGGWPYDANQYVINYGLMSENDYPYYGYQENRCYYSSNRVVARMSRDYSVQSGNEDALKTASALIGPIEVCIEVKSSFQSYQSGVYYDGNCHGQSNHAVLVVGYGTDPRGGDYWLVKNSWGAYWGDNGYIKMARNQNNMCRIASYASYALA